MNEVWLRPALQNLHVSHLALISYPDGVAINLARCVQSMGPQGSCRTPDLHQEICPRGHQLVLDVPWSLHIGCTRRTHGTQVISVCEGGCSRILQAFNQRAFVLGSLLQLECAGACKQNRKFDSRPQVWGRRELSQASLKTFSSVVNPFHQF